MLIGAFAPDHILYTAELSYPEPDFYVMADTVITIEVVEEPLLEEEGIYCSCMIHLKRKGIIVSQKNASDLVPNFFGTPETGDVAIFHYTDTAHAAFVEFPYPSGNFVVSENNYEKCKYTTRLIMADDPFLIGFIRHVGNPF